MSGEDLATVMGHVDTLIHELYAPYDGLEEADMALRQTVRHQWVDEYREMQERAEEIWAQACTQTRAEARRQFVEMLKSGKTPEELIAMYSADTADTMEGPAGV